MVKLPIGGLEWIHTDQVGADERYPGVRIRRLWKGNNGPRAILVEIDPGCGWAEPDVHDTGPEEVFVVSGVFNDGARDFPAGTFIHNPAGSAHVPQSRVGCVLFVFYPEG